MDSKFHIENPVNNDKYLQMLFAGFREQHTKKPQESSNICVDKDKIKQIRENIGNAQQNAKQSYIRRPMPQFVKGTLTDDSWEECLDYYEIMMDRLGEKKPYDIDRILELELWFYPLIEPLSGNKERWYSREITKVTKYHSHYLQNNLREIVAYLVYENFGKEGAQKHLDKINALVQDD